MVQYLCNVTVPCAKFVSEFMLYCTIELGCRSSPSSSGPVSFGTNAVMIWKCSLRCPLKHVQRARISSSFRRQKRNDSVERCNSSPGYRCFLPPVYHGTASPQACALQNFACDQLLVLHETMRCKSMAR